DPKTLGDSGGPITKDQNGPEIYGTIFSIAPSPKDSNTIWTGSDDGLVYVTRDTGEHWDNITPKDFPEFMRISLIDASPTKPGTAYLAGKRYQLDDRKPYIYRTDDYGKTWTKIVNGIPQDDFVHVVREDPKRPGLLYAGAEHGVYISFDDGGHWQSLSLNLPDTQVSDLLVQDDDLAIATHGRSFYVLDDITVLRQLKPEIANESLHLFRPRPAVRSVNQAFIDYYLKQPADKVTVQILDGEGELVRSFEGSAEEEKKSKPPADADQDSEFGGPPRPKPPTRAAGLNRFTWDLRYPGAKTFEGMVLWGARAEQGPLAPPGEHHARIIVNGVMQTEKLRVMKDPRLSAVTNADLQEQFKLASQVRDKVSEADEMVIRIRTIKNQLKDRSEKAKNPDINAASERLSAKLTAVEEDLYQVQNRSNQDPLNFPIKLNNQLAALARSIETGDAKPTDASYIVFQELNARLDALKARLADALTNNLAQVNGLLTNHQMEKVSIP
ncbi:MAG TPA: glycosyl hydrolase, partial [Bryobacteraceae bacterium]